jgi:hypothetical protein
MSFFAATLWMVLGLSLFAWAVLANSRYSSAVASTRGPAGQHWGWLDFEALPKRQTDPRLESLRRWAIVALLAFGLNIGVGFLVISFLA